MRIRPSPAVRQLELTIREPDSGVVLLRISLEIPAQPDIPQGVVSTHPTIARSGKDAPEDHGIAGSIKPPPSDLDGRFQAWLDGQRARRQKSSGLSSYRQRVRRFLDDSGIRQTDEVNSEAVERWLSEKGERWTGATYNNALSAIGSFTRYLHRVGAIPADPCVDIPRAFEDGAHGSRAASTEEAAAILRAALLRQENDARCTGDRALYWACLFLHGCRIDEPSRWRRKHLLLDEEIPILHWTPDIQKNRREQESVIAPELVPLLRRQREQMRALAATTPFVEREYRGEVVEVRGIDPDDPEAFVFPRVPSPATFGKDRERAGVPYLDSRGRKLSPHSARKWFSTTLTMAGVPKEIRDHLMRHKTTVEGRYVDAQAADHARFLAGLPRIWPVDALGGMVNSGGAGLTKPKPRVQITRLARQPAKPDSDSTPGFDRSPSVWQDNAAPKPGFEAESSAGEPGAGSRGCSGDESSPKPVIKMAPPGFEPGTERL